MSSCTATRWLCADFPTSEKWGHRALSAPPEARPSPSSWSATQPRWWGLIARRIFARLFLREVVEIFLTRHPWRRSGTRWGHFLSLFLRVLLGDIDQFVGCFPAKKSS